MLDKLFDKLPYETLEKIKFVQLLMGAVGAGALILIVYYFTLYGMSQNDSVELAKKKEAAESKLKSSEALVARTNATSRDLAAVGHNFADAIRGMPRSHEMPQLLNKINDFERELGVEILLFLIEEGRVKDFYKEVPVKILVKGDFWNAVGFLDKLQDLLRIVNVSDLKMEFKKPQAKAKKGKKGEEEESDEPPPRPYLLTEMTAKTYAYIEGAESKLPAQPPAEEKK